MGCVPCTECVRELGQWLVTPCTSVTDTICGTCPDGSFSVDSSQCMPCTRCGIMQEVSVECTTASNRVCKQCSEGKYTDGTTPRCIPYSLCPPGTYETNPIRELWE